MAQESLTTRIRIWVDKYKGRPDAPRIYRLVASLIWFLHEFRYMVISAPRMLRIWIWTSAWAAPFRPALRIWENEIGAVVAFSEDRFRESVGSDDRDPARALEACARYAEESAISGIEREEIARRMARYVDAMMTRRHAYPTDSVTRELEENGLVALPDLKLSAGQIADIRRYLETRKVYNAHVSVYSDGVARSFAEAKSFPYGSFKTDDTIQCPHLLELAFHPRVLSLAEAYLGCTPSLYSVHSWWSFPGFSASGPQMFHRDYDDYRFLSLFVFLTDVEGGAKGGEHEFILGTHQFDTTARVLGGRQELASEFFYPKDAALVFDQSAMYRRVFAQKIHAVTGAAGSVFLADTYAFHRGVKPVESGRLVCWMRFGLRKNRAFMNDQTRAVKWDWSCGRIADTPYNRFVGRLLLNSSL